MILESLGIDYYLDRGISNSSLSLINTSQGGSPRFFKMYLDGKIENKKKSLSLENGSLIHEYCEKPDEFAISTVEKPNQSIINVAEQYCLIRDVCIGESTDDILIKAARLAGYYNNYKDDTLLKTLKKTNIFEYIEEVDRNHGKHIITLDQKNTIEGCIKALQSHPKCRELLFDESNYEVIHEMEIYFLYKNLRCKARLDKVIIDHNNKKITLIDLKTTSKRIQFFRESWEFWHYYRQPAYYKLALSIKYPGYKVEVFYPVVDTQYFNSCVYKISDSEIDRGEIEYNHLIDLINWHTENGWEFFKEEYDNNLILNL